LFLPFRRAFCSIALFSLFDPIFYVIIASLVVNEVASTGLPEACDGEDYVELKNVGTTAVSTAGLVLADDNGPTDDKAYNLTSDSLDAGAIQLLCKDTNFTFGIGGSDSVSLYSAMQGDFTLLSTSGVLPGFGSSTATYQRQDDGTYRYAEPTPDANNDFQDDFMMVVVNEVADKGVGTDVCSDEDYIELRNLGPNPVDLTGLVLSDSNGFQAGYPIPQETIMGAQALLLFCKDASFSFGIGGTDSVTLYTPSEIVLSTTGQLTDSGSPTSSLQRRENGQYEYSLPTHQRPTSFSRRSPTGS
jgi:hypothetical protein